MTQKVTPEMRREMVRLYTENRLTATAIGQQMSVSNAHVSKILKEEGVASRLGKTPKYNPDAVKSCKACGSEFRRKIMGDGKLEKPSQFNRRTTCSRACQYVVTGGKRADQLDSLPWSVGKRTLLAKTCPACGFLLSSERFQRQARGFYATTCKRCVQRGWMDGLDPDVRDAVVKQRNLREKQVNDSMRPAARRHGEEWTGPELEVVARRELTAVAAAALIGRTPAAVRRQRHLLGTEDPMTVALAGLSKSSGNASSD